MLYRFIGGPVHGQLLEVEERGARVGSIYHIAIFEPPAAFYFEGCAIESIDAWRKRFAYEARQVCKGAFDDFETYFLLTSERHRAELAAKIVARLLPPVAWQWPNAREWPNAIVGHFQQSPLWSGPEEEFVERRRRRIAAEIRHLESTPAERAEIALTVIDDIAQTVCRECGERRGRYLKDGLCFRCAMRLHGAKAFDRNAAIWREG